MGRARQLLVVQAAEIPITNVNGHSDWQLMLTAKADVKEGLIKYMATVCEAVLAHRNIKGARRIS